MSSTLLSLKFKEKISSKSTYNLEVKAENDRMHNCAAINFSNSLLCLESEALLVNIMRNYGCIVNSEIQSNSGILFVIYRVPYLSN